MYKPGQSMRLEYLKRKNFNPKTILDIGAHTGQFYGWAKKVWPNAFIWMVEANECHISKLDSIVQGTNDRYTIAALGANEKEVIFWTRKDKPHTEGNSYYREKAFGNLAMEVPRKLKTLNNLFDSESTFDLIKLDTQGSELDILTGGKHVCQKAKYIILEISLIDLNFGAPSKDKILSYMEAYGFTATDIIGEHYFGTKPAADEAGVDMNTIIQQDILFKNKKK